MGTTQDVAGWLGPQYSGDDPLTRRYRFHQSWYRAFVLGVPCGTGPQPSSTSSYGNFLTASDGAAGRNFVTPGIAALAEERIAKGGTVEPYRVRHNLLSSQPLCFNLFGQLQLRPRLAKSFVEDVIGVPVTTTEVRIEDSPGYLGDRTGLDASIRYATSAGASGVIAIETKLTERFSDKVYELDSREEYQRYSTADGSPFDQSRLAELTDRRWNQLWRNQMLAEAIRVEEDLADSRQVVVHPAAAEDTSALVDSYRGLLTHPDAVRSITIEDLVARCAEACEPADRAWLDAFNVRYLDLWLSEPLFERRRAGAEPFAG